MSVSTDLMAQLASEGPIKHQPAGRRVRILLAGQWIVDTLEAELVWEHAHYPLFYVPLAAVQAGSVTVSTTQAGWCTGRVVFGQDPAAEITILTKGPLSGLAKLSGPALQWFEEDEPLLGSHPKDPYKRVDCLASSRVVRIEVDGVVVAETGSSVFLCETGLRTRYYLPRTAVRDWSQLSASDTTSACPYKGRAQYYDLTVGGRRIRDAVWYYTYPTHEAAAIAGRVCFYNEKVDVFIDGKKEKQ